MAFLSPGAIAGDSSSQAVTNAGTFATQDSYLRKNVDGLNGLTVRTTQFSLIKKDVLSSPSTVSGNSHIAFDGDHTAYFYSPATGNSQIYSYDILTDTVTALTNGTTLEEAYAGATILYANGNLYFTRGGGYNAFYRLNVSTLVYTVLASTSNGTNFGCAMVYDGSNYIYLRNATPAMERYSISGNSWSTMTAPGSAGAEGLSLVLVGNNLIYSFQGGGSTGFSVYSITANTWTSKTATPDTIYDGGGLAWNGDNYIYALRGIGATTMYRYDILANTWSTLGAMPILASTGSGIITLKDGMMLCYLTDPSGITAYGVVNNLYVFDPTRNSILQGRYNSTQPTLVNGQQGELQLSSDGSLATAPDTTTEGAADAVSNTIRVVKDVFGFSPVQKSFGWVFNGTTWDRMPGTTSGVKVILQTQTDTVMVGGVNIKEINGVTPLMGAGNTGTGSLRVTIASDQAAVTVDTELPTAAALSNGATNPTAPAVGSFLMVFNGTTWDRKLSAVHATDSTGTGIEANAILGEFDDTSPTTITENRFGNLRISSNRNLYTTLRDSAGNERGANVTASNELNVLDTNSGSIKTSVELIDDVIFTDDTSTHTPATTKVLGIGMVADEASTDSVNEGDIGMPRMTLDRKAVVTVMPTTANGLSVFNATSSDGATALTNSAQAVKAAAGQVYGWYIYNPNSSAQFVQFYNTAAASVTVGTTNPLFMLTIPATAGANVEYTNGIEFTNAGFSIAATSTAGGNGAPSTALDVVVFYK